MTERNLSRRIWLMLVAGLLVGGGTWLSVSVWTRCDSLECGLECVANDDLDGVNRIEQALIGAGRDDEAAVVWCAWLVRRGQHAEVLRQLNPAMIDGPQRRHVLRLVGESLFYVGDFEKAELLLRQQAAEFPDEVAAHRVLSAMYYDLGANNLALQELTQVERLAPLDFRPHHLAGLIHADGEDFSKAINQLRQALDKSPPAEIRAAIQLELARALSRNREYQAVVDLLTAHHDSPNHDTPDRSAVLAECYWSLGERDKAATLTDEVLQSEPGNTAALRLKSRLLEERGQLDEALSALRKVLAAEPYDVEGRYQLVQLLGVRGLDEERDREQQEYLRLRALHDRLVKLNQQASDEPDAVAPRRELVQVCGDLGRPQLAEMWERAVMICEQRQRLQESADRVTPVGKSDTGDDKSP